MALPTTNRVELINKREFAKAVLDKNFETFVIYMVALEAESSIYSLQTTQIAALQSDKAHIEIPAKYSNFADVLSPALAMEFSKNKKINEHNIGLLKSKQAPYGSIYTFSLVELKTLKTYIETYIKTEFIWLSISLANAPIFLTRNRTVVFVYV